MAIQLNDGVAAVISHTGADDVELVAANAELHHVIFGFGFSRTTAGLITVHYGALAGNNVRFRTRAGIDVPVGRGQCVLVGPKGSALNLSSGAGPTVDGWLEYKSYGDLRSLWDDIKSR